MQIEKPLIVLAVLSLLVGFAGFALSSMDGKSVTADELIHIPAGFAYLKTLDSRLCLETPCLTGLLCGLALLPIDPEVPLDHPAWKAAATGHPDAARQFGKAFFEKAGPGPKGHRILDRTRSVMVFLGALACLFLFLLGRALLGTQPAFLALILFCFSPPWLGHARLVSPEVPLVAFTLMALYFLLRFWRTRGKRFLLAAGLGLGLALATSPAAVFLVPILASTALLSCWMKKGTREQPEPDAAVTPLRTLKELALLLAVALGVVLLLSMGNLGAYSSGLARFFPGAGPDSTVSFFGQQSTTGFLKYFLVVMAVKTPVPTCMLVVAGVLAVLFGRAGRLRSRELLLVLLPITAFLLLAALAGGASSTPYLLSAFPLLTILAGGLLAHVQFQGWGPRVAVWTLAATSTVSAFVAYPDYLSYFNTIAGGSSGGARILNDSNIDRGQDLAALGDFCRTNRIQSIGLLLGVPTLDPRTYGIPARPITPQEVIIPADGWYAVSVSALTREGNWAECPIRFDWLRIFQPVKKLGGTLFVFRFLTRTRTTQSPPRGFRGKFFESGNVKKDRAYGFLDEAAGNHPESGWIQGRLGTYEVALGKHRKALDSLTRALADPDPKLDPERPHWELLAGWQCLPLGRISQSIDHLSRAEKSGHHLRGWLAGVVTNLTRVRAALRSSRADPGRQQDALAAVHRLAQTLSMTLGRDAKPMEISPEHRRGYRSIARFCKEKQISSITFNMPGWSAEARNQGIPARMMQPEETITPEGWYAMDASTFDTYELWPGCKVLLDWNRRYVPVQKFGDSFHLYYFRVLQEGEAPPPAGTPGTLRPVRDCLKDAVDILEKSLEKFPDDPWCNAELALLTLDTNRLILALDANPRITHPYRLRWLITGAYLMMRLGRFQGAEQFLAEISNTRRIRHPWLGHVVRDLARLRLELGQGRDPNRPPALPRIQRITGQLGNCLSGRFLLPDRARLLEKEGFIEEAVVLMAGALERIPLPAWFEEAGIWNTRIWRMDDAISSLEKAGFPHSPPTIEYLCRALAFRGLLRRNAEDMERARQLHVKAVNQGLFPEKTFEELVNTIRDIPTNLLVEIEGGPESKK